MRRELEPRYNQSLFNLAVFSVEVCRAGTVGNEHCQARKRILSPDRHGRSGSAVYVSYRPDVRVFAMRPGVWGLTMLSPTLRAGRGGAAHAERTLLHDLSNAAASVQVLIDLLEEPASDESRVEYLRMLQNSMQQLRSRIDNQKNCGALLARRPGREGQLVLTYERTDSPSE